MQIKEEKRERLDKERRKGKEENEKGRHMREIAKKGSKANTEERKRKERDAGKEVKGRKEREGMLSKERER